MRARRRGLAVVALGLLLGAGIAKAATGVKAIRPVSSLCVGGKLRVGVRYLGGGKRRYAVRVVAPNGVVVFGRDGRATRTWKVWRVSAARRGTYRVRYKLAGRLRTYYVKSTICPTPGLITDNDGGRAALTLAPARPDEASAACLIVTYKGSTAAQVRLFGSTAGTGLAAHLHLTVTRGVLPAETTYPSCEGFVPDPVDHAGAGPGVVFDGTLDSYPRSYDMGIPDPARAAPVAWTSGESHAYLLQVTLRDENAAQGKTAQQSFAWEVRG